MNSVPVTAWLCNGWFVLNTSLLHDSRSDRISLIVCIHSLSRAVTRRLDSSRQPFIMLHSCHDYFCTLRRGSSRNSHQDRVASVTTWRRPTTLRGTENFYTAAAHSWVTLGMVRRHHSPAIGYIASGTSAPSRCDPESVPNMLKRICIQHMANNARWPNLQLDRNNSDDTRHYADVILDSSQLPLFVAGATRD